MANERKSNTPPSTAKYRQVKIAGINRGRRGKHHELVQGIVKELMGLPGGSALEIPVSDVGGIGLANLRSAVHRAASSHNIEIETVADAGKFYVWKSAPRE